MHGNTDMEWTFDEVNVGTCAEYCHDKIRTVREHVINE
jgi:hypothetical protein